MTAFEVLITCEPEFTPTQGNAGDAGHDLRSRIHEVIPAGKWKLIPTGVSIAMPNGLVGLVHPRSGLALKHGITLLNSPGTVDAGYRGEISVTLINLSDLDFVIEQGDRIAQIVFQEIVSPRFVLVTELPGSQRGSSGFGSTGVK